MHLGSVCDRMQRTRSAAIPDQKIGYLLRDPPLINVFDLPLRKRFLTTHNVFNIESVSMVDGFEAFMQ